MSLTQTRVQAPATALPSLVLHVHLQHVESQQKQKQPLSGKTHAPRSLAQHSQPTTPTPFHLCPCCKKVTSYASGNPSQSGGTLGTQDSFIWLEWQHPSWEPLRLTGGSECNGGSQTGCQIISSIISLFQWVFDILWNLESVVRKNLKPSFPLHRLPFFMCGPSNPQESCHLGPLYMYRKGHMWI